MFAPLYRAGVAHSIAPVLLDASPPHVVRWALVVPPDPDAPETHDEYLDSVRARMAELEGEGMGVPYEPFDPAALAGL